MESNKEFVLEEGMDQLEQVLNKLEQEGNTLEESFALYQKGMLLLKQCNESIDKIEHQVMVLNADGELSEFE